MKESEEFALIFEGGDPVQVGMVSSMLEEAGIRCLVKNAGVQNLFGLGSLGGMNPLIGVVKIYVKHEDLEAAQQVLSQAHDLNLRENPGVAPEQHYENPHQGFLTRLRKWILGR